MKRRFNFLKALLPFILAIGTFSACDQDSPGVKITVKNWPEQAAEARFRDVGECKIYAFCIKHGLFEASFC